MLLRKSLIITATAALLGVTSAHAEPKITSADALFQIDPAGSYEVAISTADYGNNDDLRRSDIRRIQRYLNAKGYSVGTADGYIGGQTRRGIMNWGHNNGFAGSPGMYPHLLLSRAQSYSGGTGGSGSGSAGGGGSCGFYAITTCGRSYSTAQRGVNRYGGYVINTSSSKYPNFNSGYYCAVKGPFGRDRAKAAAQRARWSGASSAYHKRSC